jgi:calcium-dependent protein kinase
MLIINIMGNICTNEYAGSVPSSPINSRRHSSLTSKHELRFNAGIFVQENKDSFESVYQIDKKPIGTGAFAEVWVIKHRRTGDTRASKIFKKSELSEEDLNSKSMLMEIEILKTLDHPNVLKVYEYFEDSDNFYIVMEYCEGGDVFEKLMQTKTFTERYAARVIRFVLKGLCYLHSKHVVHRDIKLENLLITNSDNYNEFSIKIIDFNISTRKREKKIHGAFGTTDYMAPEVFRGIYDEKCDLWSCGVILYLMVSGSLPFQCDNNELTAKAICDGRFSYPRNLFRNISYECKDLIARLLTKSPSLRLSAAEALNHKWLLIAEEKIDNKDLFTTFMISQLSKSSNLKKFENIFYAIDTDRNGVITHDELVNQFCKEMPKGKAEQEAKKIFGIIDNDGSGEIDYTEFLRVTVDEDILLTKENLKKAFMYFDKDNSEAIEKMEIKEWLSVGDIIPEEVINELMEEADTNGDGTIDLNEFEALLINKLELNG